jgi:hypothetical protein
MNDLLIQVESSEAIAMLKTLEEDLAASKRKHQAEMEEAQYGALSDVTTG